MDIENHCNSAKVFLDKAMEKLNADNLSGAAFAIAHALINVREMAYHVCEKKRNADLEKVPAGEDVK